MLCPLCNSNLTGKKDDFYYSCDLCKALVKDAEYYLSAEKEKARYETHNNDVNNVGYQNFTSPITNYVLNKYLPAHKGLDFGCGTGPVISSMLLKQVYDIVQFDPYFAPDYTLLNSTYDYIVACEVFEHFHKPSEEITKLIGLLKPEGKLLVMTMLYDDTIEFSNWNYRNDATHVFIYTLATIDFIANEWKLEAQIISNRFIIFSLPVALPVS